MRRQNLPVWWQGVSGSLGHGEREGGAVVCTMHCGGFARFLYWFCLSSSRVLRSFIHSFLPYSRTSAWCTGTRAGSMIAITVAIITTIIVGQGKRKKEKESSFRRSLSQLKPRTSTNVISGNNTVIIMITAGISAKDLGGVQSHLGLDCSPHRRQGLLGFLRLG